MSRSATVPAVEPHRRDAPHPALPAAALALLAATEIGLEAWTRGLRAPGALLRGEVLPALLWVAATPVIMALGRRWPGRTRWRADLARHALAFGSWFFATNLLIRLPEWSRVGGYGTLLDTRAGMVTYAPAALLLWAVLAWIGRGPASPPIPAGTSAVAADAAPEAPRARPAGEPAILVVPGLNRVHRVPHLRILRLEADGDHVLVHTLDGIHRVRGTLNGYERKLAASGSFVRIHRSHLVNAAHVREVQPYLHGDYVAVTRDDAELRVPRTRRKALDRLLGRSAG